MSSPHLTIWPLKMFRQNYKPIEDKWSPSNNRTKLKKVFKNKNFKMKKTKSRRVNISQKLVTMIRTKFMGNHSRKSMRWLKKIKKRTLKKLLKIKYWNKNLTKILKLHNTQKNINSIWFKKMQKTSCTVQSDKISLNGTNLLNRLQSNQQKILQLISTQNLVKKVFQNSTNLCKN